MARPASRKAVSSLPAIANIDEQLDEVVMDKKAKEIKHIFISEYAMDQLSDDEQKRYLKILSENVVRTNANYRLQKQAKN